VEAFGCGPFEYQWYWNGTNVLEGATNAVLNLSEVMADQAGSYGVRVSNGYGSVDSDGAELVVLVPAQVVEGPVDAVVVEGEVARFEVVARGTPPLSYWWYFNETNLLADATNAVLELNGVTMAQAGLYTVVVSNAYGNTNFSAELTVLAPGRVVLPPADALVPLGGTAEFTVLASGNPPPSYQWYFEATNLIAGATGPTLVVENVTLAEAGLYSVQVSNTVGSEFSAPAALSISVLPYIAAQPESIGVLKGSTAQFSVVALGAPPFSYQWFFQGTNALVGATNASLALPNVDFPLGGKYSVTVSNEFGSTNSLSATLRVLVEPKILTITRSGSVVTLTFSTTSNLLYSVYYSLELGDSSAWTVLPKALRRLGTGLPITIQDAQATNSIRYYRVGVE
jgi:hypothetical protein